jgi:general secretion pathway protein C
MNVFEAKLAPDPVPEAVPVRPSAIQPGAAPSLDGYAIVSERNLFGGDSGDAGPVPEKEIDLEEIPLASKSLGLKLVGTVVTGRSDFNLAIIENSSTRKQEGYREGDRVKEVLIKKVQRHNVIINTGKEDEILTMAADDSSGGAPRRAPAVKRQRSKSSAKASNIKLKREEIESSLKDLTELMKQVKIDPVAEDEDAGGFKVSEIKSGSLFNKLGLRNGDIVQQINEQAISDTEQAIELYESLMDGGEITLEIKRGRRNKRLVYEVE